ncbi:MAG: DUF2142 domain-containing protein [Gemmiger sp.]|nr:DUF2142 domain-containing protein [Gemmiger sp.]
MPNTPKKFLPAKRTRLALLGAAVCFVVCFLVWLAAVRPAGDKSLGYKLSDDYATATPLAGSASQTFTYDDDLLALAFVFTFEPADAQPTGSLQLTVADAATGAVLATSTGEMGNILPGQYTGLGLDHRVAGQAGRQYKITLTPTYTGTARLALGHSATSTLWNEALTVDGQPADGTAALLITYRQIGGFLSRFYWCIAAGLVLLVGAGLWLAGGKTPQTHPHRAVFVLVLLVGLLYSAVLPPYAAPDEQYHINQSFTLACRWANFLSGEEWRMGNVPLEMSYRRLNDNNPLLQDETTTVFTWQEAADNFFTRTDDAFSSHAAREEAQTDRNPTLYLASAAAVFLGFLLHLGFVPTLFLGRFANLLLYAALAALAVKKAPLGKRVFMAVALLPMSLHLGASFSRDGPLLGFCLLFIALCLGAALGETPPSKAHLAALAACGLVLAPAKLVYLPLVLLVLVIPAARLGGKKALPVKLGYLALCTVLTLAVNSTIMTVAATTANTEAAASQANETAQSTQVNQTSANAPATQAEAASFTATAAKPVIGDSGVSAAASGTDSDTTSDANPEANSDAAAAANPSTSLSAEEAAALAAPTAEGFVRRLYYYGAGTLAVPQAEVDFWVQALAEGDVSAGLLGQSFFFAPGASFTDAALISAASGAFLNRDILQKDTALLTLAAQSGVEQAYKAIFSSEEAALLLGAGIQPGSFDTERLPLDRADLVAEVEAARATRAKQSVATGADAICFTPGYILANLPTTAMLVVNSALQNTDDYLRTLVGGSLSYYTLDLAWGWVLLLYLLLAFAALPAADAVLPHFSPAVRLVGWLAALGCCGLVVLGCITWTPTYYQTIYGLQGRYFLPVLPLALLLAAPRRVRVATGSAGTLLAGLCIANAGVLLNAMLAVIAR